MRQRARLVLEELLLPASYAILPSEAAEAAEQELCDQILKDDQSGMQLYLARLQDIVLMLAPSSPDFQPALLEALTSGILYTRLSSTTQLDGFKKVRKMQCRMCQTMRSDSAV